MFQCSLEFRPWLSWKILNAEDSLKMRNLFSSLALDLHSVYWAKRKKYIYNTPQQDSALQRTRFCYPTVHAKTILSVAYIDIITQVNTCQVWTQPLYSVSNKWTKGQKKWHQTKFRGGSGWLLGTISSVPEWPGTVTGWSGWQWSQCFFSPA